MPQSQFILRQGYSKELAIFPHIVEFGLKKNNAIKLNSFSAAPSENLQIYFVIDGKFEWIINQQHHFVYPGDTAVVLPRQEIGGAQGYLGIGAFIWLHLKVKKETPDAGLQFGKWSNLTASECRTMGKILYLNKLPVMKIKEVASLLKKLHLEIKNQEIGYITRVNYMLDSLLIIISRQSTRQGITQRDFPKTFTKLEQTLRESLNHQWTVEEMAAMVGLCSTSFSEKVKSYTGFSPQHYLINLRISEGVKLLKQNKINITDIALETGFYSSQHFSTTFKKLTGYTPGEFRKSYTANKQS